MSTVLDVIKSLCDEIGVNQCVELTVTIRVCVKTGRELLDRVLNKDYYPTLTDERRDELMDKMLVYTVLNVLYPYTTNTAGVKQAIAATRHQLEDLCVDYCLLQVLDDSSLVQQMLNYLSETFYQLK